MPLFYQHNINQHTKLAVWKISEPEEFFLKKVSLQKEITHKHKRLQHLAGRYLLQILYPQFPIELIETAESKKPFLPNQNLHFSISHCGDFAAAIISRDKLVGIDVELVCAKIENIKHKFLSTTELELVTKTGSGLNIQNYNLLTLCWSVKETIFKWYGKGGINFKKNMIIQDISFKNDEGLISARFEKGQSVLLAVNYKFFESLCLTWVC
ncbi:MAG: 4'-phosphopantetheinyl transferase family protein [Ginsengibacter sp.]